MQAMFEIAEPEIVEPRPPIFTVILSCYWKDFHFLPHAFECLFSQTFKDFELLVTVKLKEGMPQGGAQMVQNTLPCEWLYYLDDNSTGGNRERNLALQKAKGKYVAWYMADNLVYPLWLENHVANFQSNPEGISIVNIDYWKNGWRYASRLPVSLEYGRLDLLNMAMPVELARRIDAFGPYMEHDMCSDWRVFERARRSAPVTWIPSQEPCACHF